MNLPPLPSSQYSVSDWLDADTHVTSTTYTADQMRKYGEACRKAALREAATEADEYTRNTYGATYGVGNYIRKYLK
jgi:hypothetical protein